MGNSYNEIMLVRENTILQCENAMLKEQIKMLQRELAETTRKGEEFLELLSADIELLKKMKNKA